MSPENLIGQSRFKDTLSYLTRIASFQLTFSPGLKLELEFVVLNQLMEIAKAGVPGLSSISASGTEFTITHMTQTTSLPMASPSSGATLPGKQDWWPHPNSDATESRSTMTLRRDSSAHTPMGGGLGVVSGGQRMPTRRPIDEITEERSLSLDHIGVIPDP